MIYLTSYLKEGQLYGSEIEATSWEEAELKAKERGLGETVDGYISDDDQE